MANLKELKKALKRGVKVSIRDTYSKDELHDETMHVASHGTVECKQNGHCAEDRRCVKLAVFVSREDRSIETDGPTVGWRKGAYKVCLSHLLFEDSASVLKPTKVVVEEFDPNEDEETLSVVGDDVVTWVQLAEAAQLAEAKAGKRAQEPVRQLILLARRLKSADERTTKKLAATQERLLEIQTAALEEVLEPAEMLPEQEDSDAERPE